MTAYTHFINEGTLTDYSQATRYNVSIISCINGLHSTKSCIDSDGKRKRVIQVRVPVSINAFVAPVVLSHGVTRWGNFTF